jgi:hypothetical protein
LLVLVLGCSGTAALAKTTKRACNQFLLKTEKFGAPGITAGWVRATPGVGVPLIVAPPRLDSNPYELRNPASFASNQSVRAPANASANPGVLRPVPSSFSPEVSVSSPNRSSSASVKRVVSEVGSLRNILVIQTELVVPVTAELTGPSQVFGWLDDSHLVVLSSVEGPGWDPRGASSFRSDKGNSVSVHLFEVNGSSLVERKTVGPPTKDIATDLLNIGIYPLFIDRSGTDPVFYFTAKSSLPSQYPLAPPMQTVWSLGVNGLTDTGGTVFGKGGIVDGIVSIDGQSVVRRRSDSSESTFWSLRNDVTGEVRSISAREIPFGAYGYGWVSLSPNGNYAALAQHGSVVIWDRGTGKSREVFGLRDYSRDPAYSMVWAHGGLLLFGDLGAVFVDQRLRFHDLLRSNRLVSEFATVGPACFPPGPIKL